MYNIHYEFEIIIIQILQNITKVHITNTSALEKV